MGQKEKIWTTPNSGEDVRNWSTLLVDMSDTTAALGKSVVVSLKMMIFLPWLVGPSEWSAGWPANQSVASSISSQGTYQLGAHERQPHIDVSLPLVLSPFPSLKNK